jgi:hypothetical protein
VRLSCNPTWPQQQSLLQAWTDREKTDPGRHSQHRHYKHSQSELEELGIGILPQSLRARFMSWNTTRYFASSWGLTF